MGEAIAIVLSDPGHSNQWIDRSYEACGRTGATALVRHLEHRTPFNSPGPQEPQLRGLLNVTCQQKAHRTQLDSDNERPVVLGTLFCSELSVPPGPGVNDLDLNRGRCRTKVIASLDHPNRDPPGLCRVQQGGHPSRETTARRNPDGTHRSLLDDSEEPLEVVSISMRNQDAIEVIDACSTKGRQNSSCTNIVSAARCAATINQPVTTRRQRQQQRISLADIQGGQTSAISLAGGTAPRSHKASNRHPNS